MKRLLLLLIVPALLAGNLTAQLSMEANQILYLNFDDDADLGYNDEDVLVTDEDGVIGDEGMFNGGIYFDGDGDYLIFDPIEDWNHGMDWTLSLWLKTEVTDDFFGILSFSTYSGDPMTDWMDGDASIGGLKLSNWANLFEVEVSWLGGVWSELDPPAWNDGEWHHVVITYDGDLEADNMFIYMDNALYAEPIEPFNIAIDVDGLINDGIECSVEDDNIKLGFAAAGWNYEEDGENFYPIMWYTGFMDDFRLFDITLTAEDVAEIFEYAPTGINEVQTSQLFSIYPNPASDIIKIRTNSPTLEVYVYNIAGQVVLSSFDQTSINISSLQKGMYFVDVTVNGEREVQKLIIK